LDGVGEGGGPADASPLSLATVMQTLKSKIVPTAEGERLQIVVVIRWDLPMTHSKLTQQCCKALLAVHRNASRSAADTVKAWESEGEKLVLLQGPG